MSDSRHTAEKTSPGGRSVFNDAMSPRPTSLNIPLDDIDDTRKPDMNKILRQKITSPTHMRRFDSADYFMEKDFPKSNNTNNATLHLPAAHLHERQMVQQQQHKNKFSQAEEHETRWASRTSRPAEMALNSPHPAGPRALKQNSLGDIFGVQKASVNEWAQTNRNPAMGDINKVLRAKIHGKSRLRRFDSADYFLNQSTGQLEERVGLPIYARAVRGNFSGSASNVSPIKSLAITTNVGTRGRSSRVDQGADNMNAALQVLNDTVNESGPKNATDHKMQRSKPRSLQPGRQQRREARVRLGERAEIAAKVPQSPSDNLNSFFRKKFSPSVIRSQFLRQSPTPSQMSGSPRGTPSRRRSLSRAMPGAESLRTPSDIRKAALHSRLNSQGKAL